MTDKRRAITIAIILLAVWAIFSGAAFAALPPPPPNAPASPPSSGGGGGGGGGGGSGGSSSGQPSFQPFVDPLKSSDGSIIGNLSGNTAFSVLLQAGVNATVGDKNYTLAMEEYLAQRPTGNTVLDISIQAPDSSGLPPGISGLTKLCTVNITHSSSGWSAKPGTLKLTLNVSGTPAAGSSGATYYLVAYDGASYSIYDVVASSGDAGTMEFKASPSSDSGQFTLVMAGAGTSGITTASPHATPASTPASMSSPEETNGPADPGTSTYTTIAMIGTILILIMAMLYLLFIRR